MNKMFGHRAGYPRSILKSPSMHCSQKAANVAYKCLNMKLRVLL
jgi:hypothetical protein